MATMSKVKLDVVKVNRTKIEVEFVFVLNKIKNEYILYNGQNRPVGSAKKVGSNFEVTYKTGPGPGVNRTARSMKKALAAAVDFVNARNEGRVCVVCKQVFEKELKKYHGSPACEKHSNSDYIMIL